MVLKVKDGTRGATNLCTTCQYSQIIKGSSDSQITTILNTREHNKAELLLRGRSQTTNTIMNINPFEQISTTIKEFVQHKVNEAKLEIHIALLEETATVALSRLITLNPDARRKADYQSALDLVGNKQGRDYLLNFKIFIHESV